MLHSYYSRASHSTHSSADPNDVSKEPHGITHGPDALRYFSQTYVLAAEKEKQEMENCIDALYGATLLRMQGKELSAATKAALQPISDLLHLADEKK